MNPEYARRAHEAGLVPQGHYVVCDPMGRVIRIAENVTSWSAITWQATRDGLRRVH